MSKCELQNHSPKETERGAQIFGPGGQPSNTFLLQKCSQSWSSSEIEVTVERTDN